MELRNLKTFQLAAEKLNFTQAAKLLNLSQPAVTAQIRSLENEIGHPLFFRIGKQTFLTSKGAIMKRYADRLFTSLDEMRRELSDPDPSGTVRLVIAASETFCTHYFPMIIRKYLDHFPGSGIRLVSCDSDQVITGIDSNEYDIGIISGTYHKTGITNVVISEEEDLVLIASQNLARKQKPSELVRHFPFIRYEISGPFHQQMENYIREAGINPQNVIGSSSLEAVKSAVMNDIGIGLISRNLVRSELVAGQLIEIPFNKKPVKIMTSLIIATHKLSDERTMRLIRLIEQNWNAIHTDRL